MPDLMVSGRGWEGVGGFSLGLKQPRCYSGRCFLSGLHGWTPPLSFRNE